MADLIQTVLLALLQAIYDWDEFWVFFWGIFVSIGISILCGTFKFTWKVEPLFLALTLVIGLGIHHSQKNYTKVPNINFEEATLEHVHLNLEVAELSHPEELLTLDDEAREHYATGEDPYSFSFKVVDSNPKPGEFVKKGTPIALEVSWSNMLSGKSMNTEEMEDFDPQTVYGDPSSAIPYNTWSLCFHTTPIALINRYNDHSRGGIGASLSLSEKSIVRVQLFNYITGEMADEAVCYLGDVVHFSDLFSGIYYYVAFCDGYRFSRSDRLYQVYHDDSKPFDHASWYLTLEKEDDAYSSAFKIQLLNSQGTPLPDIPVYVCAVSEDHPIPQRYAYSRYITDSNGYLCNIPWDSSDDLRPTEFQVCEGYVTQISLDNENYIPVPQANTPVIPVVISQLP